MSTKQLPKPGDVQVVSYPLNQIKTQQQSATKMLLDVKLLITCYLNLT